MTLGDYLQPVLLLHLFLHFLLLEACADSYLLNVVNKFFLNQKTKPHLSEWEYKIHVKICLN